MPQVAEQSKYLALKKSDTTSAKRQISISATQMEKALRERIKKERDEFKAKVNKRLDAIEAIIDKYVPSEITDEEKRAIKEETKQQYDETKDALADLYN